MGFCGFMIMDPDMYCNMNFPPVCFPLFWYLIYDHFHIRASQMFSMCTYIYTHTCTQTHTTLTYTYITKWLYILIQMWNKEIYFCRGFQVCQKVWGFHMLKTENNSVGGSHIL